MQESIWDKSVKKKIGKRFNSVVRKFVYFKTRLLFYIYTHKNKVPN